MMDFISVLMYVGTLLLSSFMGCLIVDVVDRKSDEMAGFREPRIRVKKKK